MEQSTTENNKISMGRVLINEGKKQSYAMREGLRTLRTNLQFCGDDVQTILLTSCIPDEGKSTVTVNLARAMTEAGNLVLVIDSDMRKSVLMNRLQAKPEAGGQIYGLSHFLSGQKDFSDVFYSTNIPGLYMVFAGPSVPNPTELLEKQYFDELIELSRRHFDYIIIDCAPIGAAIDAAVIARQCDGAVIVVAQNTASAKMVVETKKQLEASGVRILGAVLNKVDMKKSSYYGHYYGKYYGKYYGDGEDDDKKHRRKKKDE